jgi:hypothetical protein
MLWKVQYKSFAYAIFAYTMVVLNGRAGSVNGSSELGV